MAAGLRVAIFDRSARDPERATGPRTCTMVASPVDVPIVEHLVGALADAALQAWPSWWGANAGTSTAAVVRLGRAALDPSAAPWVEAAAQLAASGQRPLLARAARAPQVGYLGCALGEIAVDVQSPALDEPTADTLSRGLEWLAAHLPAGDVRWLVPREAAALPGVWRLPGAEPGVGPPPARTARDPIAHPGRSVASGLGSIARDAEVGSYDARSAAGAAEPIGPAWPVRFDPVIGRPHPASPAEQALFRALQASDLAGVFRPNHPLSTQPGPRLVVDLFGATPRLVVEIDGYAFHRGPSAFQRDRDRDFCLLASGLRVLRLTHSEIMRSVDEAAAKIRAVIDADPREVRGREG